LSGMSAAMAGIISTLNAKPARSNVFIRFLLSIQREGQNG
jgi:hypothetical protein